LLLITNQAEFFDLNHMIKIKKSDDLNHDLNLDLNQVDLNLRTLVNSPTNFIKPITQACKTKLFNRCFDFDN
jgi:hypothetical protein